MPLLGVDDIKCAFGCASFGGNGRRRAARATPEAELVMLGMDRPLDDQRDAPDTPHVKDDAASPDRGTVLIDARTRREYALAYRATVDAVYERAELEASRGNADQSDERPSIVDKYPEDYIRPTLEPPRVDGPHERPEKWVRDINFDKNLPGRDNNCGECARAVASTWCGKPIAAAAISDPDSNGESTPRMTEWVGYAPDRSTMAEIARRLGQLGPGSSAIVGCDWAWPRTGGHWFNAVNDEGAIKTIDGQRGTVETWPPSTAGVGFEENWMEFSDAILFTSEGKVVQHDHS